MKRLSYLSGFIAIGVVILFSACNKNKPLLKADIAGLDKNTIYVRYVSVVNPDEVFYDTLIAENGKFEYNPTLSSPVEITLEVDKDRYTNRRGVSMAPLAYQIKFWVQPNEKVSLTGSYEDGFLSYTLKGSEELAAQTKLRQASKEAYRELSGVMTEMDKLYAKSVEVLDEKYADSLYEKWETYAKEIEQQQVKYVKENLRSFISGMYLLGWSSAETILEYYNNVDAKIKEGVLKERIVELKDKVEMKLQLEKNALALQKGAIAPDFTLKDTDGRELTLSDFSSRYIVLDFWGTWCPWCIKGIPTMKTYYTRYKNKVEFINIACRDNVEKVKEVVKKEDMRWTQLMNGEGENDIAFKYGISAYPTKVILSPELKVLGVYQGESEEFYMQLDQLN